MHRRAPGRASKLLPHLKQKHGPHHVSPSELLFLTVIASKGSNPATNRHMLHMQSMLYYEAHIVPHIKRSDECTASHTAVCCTLLLVHNKDGVPTKRCTLTLGQVPKGQLGQEPRWVDELTVEWMKGMEVWTWGTWNCECVPCFLVSKTLVQVYILDPDAPADGPQNDPARSSPSTHPSGTVPAAEIMS
ncbi:hypothetical protein B0H10DRAFT_1959831 [Mycena sp. CBHHK59/15]|nr:hypothetical protein B0H10DRAFT_1959831 [Mycena sp. CBHHK59/15]